jgi:hypothetical protein
VRDASLNLQPTDTLKVHQRNLAIACMTITRDPGELFVQGHTGSANQATAWVERVDAESLEPVRRSPALEGGPIWPGGIAAHRNGYLYVTFGRWCHRLDPDCGMVCSRILPRERPYNSFLILPDGHLVMKDFAGGRGVDALPPGVRGSELIVLEPEKLEIVPGMNCPRGRSRGYRQTSRPMVLPAYM